MRGRIDANGVAALATEPPVEPPPGWWTNAWYNRQRFLRYALRTRLRAAGAWLSTYQLTQYTTRHEACEVEAALEHLAGAGLVEREERSEPHSSRGERIVRRVYWRAKPS